jgi:hypothetical protein
MVLKVIHSLPMNLQTTTAHGQSHAPETIESCARAYGAWQISTQALSGTNSTPVRVLACYIPARILGGVDVGESGRVHTLLLLGAARYWLTPGHLRASRPCRDVIPDALLKCAPRWSEGLAPDKSYRHLVTRQNHLSRITRVESQESKLESRGQKRSHRSPLPGSRPCTSSKVDRCAASRNRTPRSSKLDSAGVGYI